MSTWKKGFLIAVGIADIVLTIIMIGYIKWGIDMPNTLAGKDIRFMGAYILAMISFLFVAILTSVFIVCLIKWRKK
jgi:hypothetical protein